MTDSFVRAVAARCLLAASPALTGCGAFHSLSPELAQEIRVASDGLSPPITDDDAVQREATAAARAELPPSPALELPPDTGLADLVRLALARNPRIQARVRDLEALGMRVTQESSLADPMLSIVPPTGGMVQTAGGEMGSALGLGIGIPWPGKLAAQGRAAEQVVRIALANLATERLRVVADVKQAWADLYQAHVALDIATQQEALMQRVRESAGARFAAGTASQQDVLRSEVELYALANARLDDAQQLQSAAVRLNVLLDRAVDAALPTPALVGPAPLQWRLLALLQRSDRDAPQLRALRGMVEHDLVQIELAHLQYYPDLTVGGMLTFIMNGGRSPVANGRDVWNLDLGVTLPIWSDKLRSGVLQRNAEVLASVLRYRDGRNELASKLQDLLARVDADYRKATTLRDAILPRADQAVRVAQSGYEAGRVEFATLIEDWRRLFDLRLDYDRALASLDRALSEIEMWTGGELPPHEPETDRTETRP